MQKKQVSFRLDEELIECLEHISSKYPRFSLTELADMVLKNFLYLSSYGEEAQVWLDQTIGRYMRGEFDQWTHRFYMDSVKRKK